ncbi:hypothetical protein [Leadbetterella sp. DM7]|uniref:hypothetical protein n=1 Tax=Leadbetterella sp. DM7 TaxID=3235085 RepID=UPI00349E505D
MKRGCFIILFFLLSCNNVEKHGTGLKENTFFPVRFEAVDSTFRLNEEGVSLKLEKIAYISYLAKWGGKENPYMDTIKILPDGNAQGYFEKDVGIYITQGCGTSCSFVNVFLMTDRKSLYFENPLIIKMKDSLIVYKGETEDSIIIIENLINKKQQKVGINLLPKAYPGLIVDSIAIQSNKTLFIQWKNREEAMTESYLIMDV